MSQLAKLQSLEMITLFPKELEACCSIGVTGSALKKSLLTVRFWNPRDFSLHPNQRVDDKPYGGGPGMVMQVQPLVSTLEATKTVIGDRQQMRVICFSPQGKQLTQKKIMQLMHYQHLVLICGRYEGIDERFINHYVDEELSIGDYVLSGGELAAAVFFDAIARLLPGVLGDEQSAKQDSFNDGLLDCPHYTRPRSINNQTVPEVLCSGNHEAIARWRKKQALGRTWLRRPDLLTKLDMNEEFELLLKEFKQEYLK